jgi:Alpha/beta hydrolase family
MPPTRFIDIPGVRIAGDLAGQGSDLVFLHGGLLDRRMWDAQFSFFAANHRAIRYDVRSAGESETTPSTQPFTHHEDLRHFLSALNISRVSLVGHSQLCGCSRFHDRLPRPGREASARLTGASRLRVSRPLGRIKVHDDDRGTSAAKLK